MLDFKTVEALEKLFESGTHGTGRYTIQIKVDYGSIVVEEVESTTEVDSKLQSLEEENEDLKSRLSEINSLSDY